MRTIGAGAKTEKNESMAALETENRQLMEANKNATVRINEVENIAYERHEQITELQLQLKASQEEVTELQLQLKASNEKAAELQALISEIREQAGEDQKSKGSKEKNAGK